jgi:hypothetical protein
MYVQMLNQICCYRKSILTDLLLQEIYLSKKMFLSEYEKSTVKLSRQLVIMIKLCTEDADQRY